MLTATTMPHKVELLVGLAVLVEPVELLELAVKVKDTNKQHKLVQVVQPVELVLVVTLELIMVITLDKVEVEVLEDKVVLAVLEELEVPLVMLELQVLLVLQELLE